MASACFWRGPSSRCLEAWARKRYTILASPPMFAEYAEVFDRLRHRYPEKPHVDWVSALRDDAELIFPAIRLPEVFIDPDVIQFAECAVAGEAGILVSGDKAHVQKAGSIRGILVVAPARFLELMG